MWLENLKELRKAKGNPAFKKIAEDTGLPERTVVRIFSGDTDNPYVDTLKRIVTALGGSLDTILADSKAVVGNVDLSTLQDDVNRLTGELTLLQAENNIMKDKLVTLTAENDLLRMKLEHKEEIIAIHNYYKSVINGLAK